MFDKTVCVKVGSGVTHKAFTLHKGLLCHYSAYFEAALNGKFAEAENGKIDLPEEDVDTFERFVFWLYTGIFHAPENVTTRYTTLCQLWVFGDRRQIPLLSNNMIDRLRDAMVEHWKAPTVQLKFIYQNTHADSALRRFVIWDFSNTCGLDILGAESRSIWPEDATWDLVKAVWKLKESGAKKLTRDDVGKVDMCQFHQHEGSEKCIVGDK